MSLLRLSLHRALLTSFLFMQWSHCRFPARLTRRLLQLLQSDSSQATHVAAVVRLISRPQQEHSGMTAGCESSWSMSSPET